MYLAREKCIKIKRNSIKKNWKKNTCSREQIYQQIVWIHIGAIHLYL